MQIPHPPPNSRLNTNTKTQFRLGVTHLTEDRAELCSDKAVDQEVDGRVDDKEYVREEPGNGDGIYGDGIDGLGDDGHGEGIN